MALPVVLKEKLNAIQVIVLDVDGVLSDGRIILHGEGEEIKEFHVQDGFGITLAKQAGLKTAILTGRISPPVAKRAKELKFDFYEAGHFHKAPALNELMQKNGWQRDQVLYMGDDILDLVCQPLVGVFVAPANANKRVKQQADWITENAGGFGAVREMIDELLEARGQLTATENIFLSQ